MGSAPRGTVARYPSPDAIGIGWQIASEESFTDIVTEGTAVAEQQYAHDPIGGDFAARRTAAHQAWWEHQPVRFDPPVDGRLDVHRAVQVGDLAQLLLIDARQYADVPPCRDTSVLDAGVGCDERLGPDRTLLGPDQDAWLLDAVATTSTEWNVLVSPTLFAGLDISGDATGEPAYYVEAWDGYLAARQRVADGLRRADADPVVLTGDYHASFVLDVGPGFDDEPLCAEFMTPAISSVPFAEDHTADNPHVQYFDPVNGYVVWDLDPGRVPGRLRRRGRRVGCGVTQHRGGRLPGRSR